MAEEGNTLFRKEALEQLGSPEQLDQLLRVTRPTGWLALFGIGLLLVAAVTWGFVGHVPTKVHGQGILVRPGGVSMVAAMGKGKVEKIFPKVGDAVEVGDVVARLTLPALEKQVENAREALREQIERKRIIDEGLSKDGEIQSTAFAGKKDSLEQQKKSAAEKTVFLKQKVKNQKKLLADGLITKQQVFTTQNELVEVKEEIEKIDNELAELEVQETKVKNSSKVDAKQAQILVDQQRRRLEELEQDYEIKRQVKSAHAGRVVELTADIGSIVDEGESILGVEVEGPRLEAVVYVSPRDGKRIQAGMDIQISPSTVKKEEHGLMLGRVRTVSEYPSTRGGMLALLNNEELVKVFSENGPPIAVYAEIKKDPLAPSGYKWTSGDGPPVKITGGTVCNADVTVLERAPIDLLIPFVKSKLGV